MNKTLLIALVTLALVGVTSAAEVLVTDNIAVSTTWTADNVYNLQNQIYVLPGASLTIEAGTLVQSTAGLGGAAHRVLRLQPSSPSATSSSRCRKP